MRISDWSSDVCSSDLRKGNNDLLTLTQPEIIRDIHTAYFTAGSDIVETNTFNSTAISQADYGREALVYEMNFEGARLARAAADAVAAQDPDRPRFVAGIGRESCRERVCQYV